VIGHLLEQLGERNDARDTPATGMATVLYMGFERAVNIATDRHFGDAMGERFAPDVAHYLAAEARLFELAIRDLRGTRK
jgi:hypothetical protein